MKKNEKMFVTSNEVELAKYIRINAINHEIISKET